MKLKKGYALITTVVVVSLLLILASSVLALSISAYKVSKGIENVNKVKLVAESGIEKGKLMLKNYILVNTNHTSNAGILDFDYLSFNPNDINGAFASSTHDGDYYEDGVHVQISFGPNSGSQTIYDKSTGRNITYIEIDVTATKGSTVQKYSVILDKSSLKNVYFDQIFKTTMTTADDVSVSGGSSFNVDTGIKLDIAGDLFLQGSNLNIFGSDPSYSFKLNEGKITVNTNSLTTNISSMVDDKGKKEDLFKNSVATTRTGWADSIPRYLKVLGITKPSVTNTAPDPILTFPTSGLPSQTELDTNLLFKAPEDPFSPGNPIPGNPTLITYKVQSALTMKFQDLISGTDRMDPLSTVNVYETIVNRLKGAPYGYSQGEDAVNNYKKIYKLILVDGNLDIDDDFQEQFINYLIYCTGTVSFKGEAHFYNSSIFAKKINFTNVSNSSGVQFYGVNTDSSLAYTGSSTLNDFSETDKMIINEYLIKNLDNYADSIEYKVIQWK